MLVCDAAKYLGFFLGPKSSDKQGAKAVAKFQDRVVSIHKARLPSQLARLQFISKAIPTLGYVAQLVNPPKNINRIGMNAVIKCLRMAGNSLSYRTAFSLDLVGGPLFPDLAMILKAILIRASLNTVTGFTSMHQQLQSMAFELLPPDVHRYKFAVPIGWDSPAFCSNLSEAHGVGCNLHVSIGHRSGSSAGKPRSSASLQAQVLKELFAAQVHCSRFWCNLLSDRLLTLCPGECFSRESVSHGCFLKLAKFPMSIKTGPRLMVIRTLVNS